MQAFKLESKVRRNARAKVYRIAKRLESEYRTPDLGNFPDPLDEAIFILLTTQTHHPNFSVTWNNLKKAFPTWEKARRARRTSIERVIRPGGLAKQKSALIKRLLNKVNKNGNLSLDFLSGLSDENAEKYLTGLPGLGLKTSRCILMYSLGRKVFPVDTHAFRIFRRLGLIPDSWQYSSKVVQNSIQDMVPPSVRYGLHVNLVVHGRERCFTTNPLCDGCPLLRSCLFSTERKRSPA